MVHRMSQPTKNGYRLFGYAFCAEPPPDTIRAPITFDVPFDLTTSGGAIIDQETPCERRFVAVRHERTFTPEVALARAGVGCTRIPPASSLIFPSEPLSHEPF